MKSVTFCDYCKNYSATIPTQCPSEHPSFPVFTSFNQLFHYQICHWQTNQGRYPGNVSDI